MRLWKDANFLDEQKHVFQRMQGICRQQHHQKSIMPAYHTMVNQRCQDVKAYRDNQASTWHNKSQWSWYEVYVRIVQYLRRNHETVLKIFNHREVARDDYDFLNVLSSDMAKDDLYLELDFPIDRVENVIYPSKK